MASLNHRRLLSELKKASLCESSCADDDNCSCTSPPPLYEHEYQPIQGTRVKQVMPPLAIIMIAILGACLLLVCYYAIIVKRCSFWKRSHRQTPQTEEGNSRFQDFLDEDHGPVLDHPIWYINTVGLEQSIIDSISMLKYKKGDGLVEGNDCSVCLSEFEEDESLRLLPKCSHAFHLPCIDTWLRSHTNCPLCRAPIVSTTTESTLSGLNTYGAREEPQMESSVREEGEVSETNGDTAEHDRRRDMEIPIENTLCNLGDKYSEIQPMRRSVSMDLSPRLTLSNSLLAEAEGSFRVDRGKKSKGRSSQKFPVGVKRSFSSGAKILLPRQP